MKLLMKVLDVIYISELRVTPTSDLGVFAGPYRWYLSLYLEHLPFETDSQTPMLTERKRTKVNLDAQAFLPFDHPSSRGGSVRVHYVGGEVSYCYYRQASEL